MAIAVLGPLTIDGENGHGLRDRVVLQALVVKADEVVDKQTLADALWGEELPASWSKMVQGCMVRLRRRLPPGSIETTPYGYRLVTHEDELDCRTFERLLGRARDHLRDRDPDRAAYVASEALALWRGRPLPDLEDWEPGRAEAARLTGLHLDAEEVRVEAEIAAGRARGIAEEIRSLTRSAPFREHRWALLARALYLSGRQTEALEVLQRARALLRDELGLDPGEELTSLEEAILHQDLEFTGTDAVPASMVCPYRGLLPYEPEDAESFFGRDADIKACLAKLRAEDVLAVVGPSGTGKSSLVRAGIVAALVSDGSRVLVTTPGARPLDSLGALPPRGPWPVLVVDQAEEVVTLCTDADERARYFDRLDAYDGTMVLAIRADRLGDLSTNPLFARLLERGLYLPGAMSEANLRAAIEGPARHAGLRLEPGLVDLLVRDIDGQPGALPLLSHALRQTWEQREGATLTVEGYRNTGGIQDAVAQSAERLYVGLDERQRAHLRDMLLRLVAPGEASGPVRTRVSRSNLALDDAHDRLIEQLVDARLLSSDDGDVQIAHEALAREWPRLRGWLDEDVEGQRIFQHLSATAETWQSMGRPDSELYRGVRLAGAVDWAGRSEVELTGTERDFLGRSQAESERELRAQKRTNRRLQLSLAGVAVLLVAALVAGFLAVRAADRSDRQVRLTADAARVADSHRLSAQALAATEPDLAVLLAVEGIHRDDSLASRSTLYSVLAKNSRLLGDVRGGAMQEVEVGPDGRVVTAGPRGLTTHNGATPTRIPAAEGKYIEVALALSPDGRVLAYAATHKGENDDPDPHPVRLLDAATHEPGAEIGGTVPGSVDIGALDFSADSRRLVAGLSSFETGANAGVQVWEVDHPARPVRTVDADGVKLRVALSPRGDIVYAATRGPDALRAWDVGSGRLLERHGVPYLSERTPPLVVSPDGSLLATSHRDGVAVYDARTLRPRFILPGQDDGVSTLAFSPDGSQLAAGFTSGTTIVWEVARQRPVRTLRGHSQPVEDVAFSVDGRRLDTVSADGQLLTWDVAGPGTFPAARQFRKNPVGGYVAIPAPDGRTVAYLVYGKGSSTSFKTAQIQFRDLTSGRLTPPRDLAWEGATGIDWDWSPDSREFAFDGGLVHVPGRGVVEHNLQVWNARTGSATSTDLGVGVDIMRYTPDGNRMVLVSEMGKRGSLTIADRRTRRPIGAPIAVKAQYSEAYGLGPGGRTFYRAAGDRVEVTDLVTRKVTVKSLPGTAQLADFSPDGTLAAMVHQDGRWGLMRAEDILSPHPRWVVPLRRFDGPNDYQGMGWSADGSVIFTRGPGTIDLWDAHNLGHQGTLQVGVADQTPDARALPDGHTLLIAHPGGEVFTWDLQPPHLLDVACNLAGRNFTRAEWRSLIGSRPYSKTCAQPG